MDPVRCHRTMHLEAPPEAVFPLLCPVWERAWIEGWEAELLRSRSGYAEDGCVFTTPRPGGAPWIWTVARHDPAAGRIRFVVQAPGSHVTLLDLALEPEPRGCRLDWTYDLVPLDEAGAVFARAYEAGFPAAMDLLERRLAHFLRTGTMLRTA